MSTFVTVLMRIWLVSMAIIGSIATVMLVWAAIQLFLLRRHIRRWFREHDDA